jgi:hypothetical protein
MKLNFKSWRIGSFFCTLMRDNGEDLWYMYCFQPFHTSFFTSHLFHKFTSKVPLILN